MQQIRSFAVLQTAKVIGAISFLVMAVAMAVLVPFMMVLQLQRQMPLFGAGFRHFLLRVLLVPPLYAVLAFMATAIACAIYNRIAPWVGGVEVELRSSAPGS